jgi:Tfp pilus assembly protein FimT
MASNINPNNINGNYPVAGQDNDSQGFRDNFTNISNNFSFAAAEITALQNSVTNVQSTVDTDGNVTAYYGNIQQGLLVGGTTTFNDDVYFDANIVLADSSTASINAIYPSTNRNYDLGTSALRFGNIWTANVVSNISTTTASVSSYKIDKTNVVASAAVASQSINILDGSRWMFTSNANTNSTFNFVGSVSTTLANVLAIGQSVRVEVSLAQGSTAYYPSAHQIDGVAQTVKWLDGNAPTVGNINSTNLYTYTITKTAEPGTYNVLGVQQRYA